MLAGFKAGLAATTAFGVLLLGVLDGMLIGAVLSMLGLVWRLNRPEIVLIARPGEGELLARVEGPVYFANVGNVHARLLELVDSAPVQPRTPSSTSSPFRIRT